MTNVEQLKTKYLNKTIKIICMFEEPHYTGKIGVCKSVDDAGQLHGSWGGCAIIPEEDIFTIIK